MKPEEIAEQAHLPLPSRASGWKVQTDHGIDRKIRVRFVMPAEDVGSFLEAAALASVVSEGENPFVPTKGTPEWWHADPTGRHLGGETSNGSWAAQIRVDYLPDGQAEIFFFGFSL